MSDYLYKKDVFIIKNFDKQKTFSSFLPGIAGEKGIPIWSFYCNRGQGISSFGIENKDNPILEFFPANTAYQYITTYGFRSFIKINGEVYEPFGLNKNQNIERNMYIEYSQFKVEEINKTLGFIYTVTYCIIPNENFGALGRYVNIENIGDEKLEFELLDGLGTIFPYGVTNSSYKEMSNLMRSWMDIYNMENNIPFFTMRASTEDSAEVKEVTSGNFYISFNDKGEILKPIIDNTLIFDYDTSLTYPISFESNTLDEILSKEQVTVNKVPCAFSTAKVSIDKKQKFNISTIVGQSDNLEKLKKNIKYLLDKDYLKNKLEESKSIIDKILNNVHTSTSSEVFNNYIKQCYLDNLLRGGYPVNFGDEKRNNVHYLYSRKHGDPERDYNFFNISPEFYSQGNGNFRDVNQNRRNDILLNPNVGSTNIELFYSLIQLDGYNPLEVKGYTYSILEKSIELIKNEFDFIDIELENKLKSKFTIGEISKKLTSLKITNELEKRFLNVLIGKYSTQNIEAKYGEGYWSDHFTYNQDLLENYLLIYPDKEKEILFDKKIIKIYESAEIVLPRKDKYVLTNKGEVRQYNALKFDKERIKKIELDYEGTNWLKDKDNSNYSMVLYDKLLLLAVTKFLNLDPSGIGIEMEANKPGWNDAMNGLPGLIGSGISETIELKRIVKFLKYINNKYKIENRKLLEEFVGVIEKLKNLLTENIDDLNYWKKSNEIKEDYRESIRLGVSLKEENINFSDISTLIDLMFNKLNVAIEKAEKLGKGIVPTFIYHEVEEFEYTEEVIDIYKFKIVLLPYFLEGPARYMKIQDNKEKLVELYNNIKKTEIYDKKLCMYKTSESIESFSNEIGRIRAFTPGWQERESVFLHMTYKYMLGLIKSGLYDKFYEEVKTNLVCFRNPKEYGRNIIENSSFLVSSANPDKNITGQGLVARLSGSTSEMLSIWNIMMVGKSWFNYNKELEFNLEPILAKEFFEDNKLSFTLFSKTKITYVNESGKNTYEKGVKVYKYIIDDEKIVGNKIKGDIAVKLRNGEVAEIIAYLK